jgi:hypothetical protein
VVFEYRPASFRVGIALAIIGVLGLAVLGALGIMARRRRPALRRAAAATDSRMDP